ncbi:MAG: ERCC4 domain-containing protein [Trueperaceae bacterium]|nr:ERCC4 domain-containing protein [Trueperaceae bacterium]
MTAAHAFLVARNPDPRSRLPYLLHLPLQGETLVLATRDRWPVTRDLYCHAFDAWPEDAEVLEEVPVVNCWRSGASVQLVLDRPARRRSIFVYTQRRGRTLIFWRSDRTMRTSRPGLRVPQARGLEDALHLTIDTRERYPWRFANYPVTTDRRRLPVGDYGVFDGELLIAAVERKRPDELANDAISGTLSLTMAELATLPRAMVVVEGRLGQYLEAGERSRAGWLTNLLAALQATHPNVPVTFAESPKFAADLAYRWLAACANAFRKGHDTSSAEMPATTEPPHDTRGSASVAAQAEPPPLFAGAPDALRPPEARHGSRQGRSHAPPPPAERREETLRRAREGFVWTVGAYAEAFHVSRATAGADLRRMRDEGALEALGRTRNLRYVLPGSSGSQEEP